MPVDPQKPRRNTSKQEIPEAAPWEQESDAQKRSHGREDAPMIGRGVRHTPGQRNDFSEGIEPDAWMAKPGAEVQTTGAGRQERGRDLFGAITLIVLGIGAAAGGALKSSMDYTATAIVANHPEQATSSFSPWWGLAAVGLIAFLRGAQLLVKKI
ncbi:MAG: hypothetical protein IT462_09790 [Planctomycetes bacterium]|nr:hypothetical protein [Planctomycetota bacterium]